MAYQKSHLQVVGEILRELKVIETLGRKLNLTGKVILKRYENMELFDAAIDHIDNYPKVGSTFEVAPGLNVTLILE